VDVPACISEGKPQLSINPTTTPTLSAYYTIL